MINWIKSIFISYRFARVLLIGLITASVTCVFGGDIKAIILSGIIGLNMAICGFYLDQYLDYNNDKISGKETNPVNPKNNKIIISLIIVNLVIAILLSLLLNPFIIILIGYIVLIVAILGFGFIEGPIIRTYSYGILQAVYILIGGFSAGNINPAIILISSFFIFAMTGIRVLEDIYFLKNDIRINVKTIPKIYGKKFAVVFFYINEIIGYIFTVIVCFTGYFNAFYTIGIVLIMITGIVINTMLLINPTDKMVKRIKNLSIGLLGILFVLSIIIGKL